MKYFLLLISYITFSNKDKSKRYDIYVDILNWGKKMN